MQRGDAPTARQACVDHLRGYCLLAFVRSRLGCCRCTRATGDWAACQRLHR